MEALFSSIKNLALQQKPAVVAIRRHLHAYPELSGEERQTAAFIAQQLTARNIPFESYLFGTGIVARIEGKNPKQTCVALRADLDALNITENTGLSFASKNPGVMHACGHDFHAANLMGVAFILHEMKQQFSGTVLLIFQPSEEKIPSGAQQLLQARIFKEFSPKSIMALHVDPDIPTGKVGTRCGAFLAAADELFITIRGKGGHGAYPHLCIDPIVISAQIVLALQTIVSRNSNPLNSTVLTIGKIESDGRTNVIPDEVHLCGTLRTFDETWREKSHDRILKIIQNIAAAGGATAEIDLKKGYPALITDTNLTGRCMTTLEKVMGKENIVESAMRMGAEDFSFFAQKFPAAFFRLGVRNETKNLTAPLHTSDFQPDEEAFETGMTLLSYLALTELAL